MSAANPPHRPFPLPLRRSAGGARLALFAVGCLACLLFAAAPAMADSIVYVKDNNVWLANPDGSGQYQVTGDGTAEHPWRTPSQADDGTIAAAYGNEIVRMRQNGEVLNRIDPPMMLDSASDPVDGPPIDVAISPDGSRIAYTMADYACPEGADCDSRTVTAYTAADHLTPPQEGGITYLHDPAWVTSSRTLQFGGFTHQVDIHDFGQPSDVHWFDDYEVVGQEKATDLGDGELNPQGTRLALIRGYGAEASLVWYDVSGDARGGRPPAPSLLCGTGADEGINGPTWSPDGQSLAVADPEGIWVKREAGNCDTPQPALVIPGGSHPDWGPAAVNPGPRVPEVVPPKPPRNAGCAAQRGAKQDRCLYEAAVRKCHQGPKGRRAKCLAAARRAYAVHKCSQGKKGAARSRCIRKALKGWKS
jgi:WD40-like Beta Propeller Repeat